MSKNTERDYPFIKILGHRLGSYQYYIQSQIEEATREDAPMHAIYRSEDGWKTMEDIKNNDMKAEMYDIYFASLS